MKHFLIIFALLVSMTTAGFARRIRFQWYPGAKMISFDEANKLATKELNKNGGTYYCLGSSVAKTFTDCDWELHFSSSDGKSSRVVSVGTDRKVRISEHGFEY